MHFTLIIDYSGNFSFIAEARLYQYPGFLYIIKHVSTK